MADMAGRGWSLGGLAAFVVAWAVMMAAMMLPAVAPLLLLYRTIASRSMAGRRGVRPDLDPGRRVPAGLDGGRRRRSTASPSSAASWLAASGRPSTSMAGARAWARSWSWLGSTSSRPSSAPACGSASPRSASSWATGATAGGSAADGGRPRAYCLGCCWALFAVLVAAGVMSLAWMLLLTLVVFAEKVLPGGRRVSIVTGGALLLLGILVASNTIGMPWRV